jgi:long-subunit fatty acid transport protein
MIQKIIACCCLLFSISLFSQEGTASPYSFYGIGDIRFKGAVENRSMGGVSVIPDSIHINLQNPAQLSSLKLTAFSVGLTSSNVTLENETKSGKARRTTFDYFAVGIPANKFAFGFGLTPFSSVGYKNLSVSSEIDGSSTQYTGEGGVNKFYFAASYKISKKINFGVDFQYNFGTIETRNIVINNNIQLGTLETNESRIDGFNFNLGLTFQDKVTKKHHLFGSLVYSPESDLRLQNRRRIVVGNQVSDQQVPDSNFKLPSKIALGVGFGEIKKWVIASEVTFFKNSGFQNRFSDINTATFENATRFSLGGYFIPNYNSFSSYIKRITYRAGVRYENTGLVIREKSINDFAANAGLGLPLSGTFSNLNINFELGKRGTVFNNLVEENYFNLSLGLSLNDRWFVRSKYN